MYLSLSLSPTTILIALVAVVVPTAAYIWTQYPLDPLFYPYIFGTVVDAKAVNAARVKRGRVSRTWLISDTAWSLWGEALGKWLLVQEKANLFSGAAARFNSELSEGTIANQDFSEHARTRRLLAPAFRTDNLRTYLPKMLSITRSQLDFWTTKSSSLYPEEGKGYIDMQAEIRQLALRIAITLLLGAEDSSLEDYETGGKLVNRYEDMFIGFFRWPLGVWDGKRRADVAKKQLLADVEAVIRKRREEWDGRVVAGKEEDEEEAVDPMWMLMRARDDNGERLSVEDLARHALLLVVAGHETTATTLTAFVAEVQQHPAVLARLRAEQDALFAQTGRSELSFQDLKKLPYMDAVFREIERMHPPLQSISRRAAKDLVCPNPDGGDPVLIKAGELIVWDVAATNRDEALYTKPNTFDPSRWLHPSTSSQESTDLESDIGRVAISNFKLGTFGAGHRVCLGMQFARMEMAVIVGMLVREFEFVVREREGAGWVKRFAPRLKYVPGIWGRFDRRGEGKV